MVRVRDQAAPARRAPWLPFTNPVPTNRGLGNIAPLVITSHPSCDSAILLSFLRSPSQSRRLRVNTRSRPIGQDIDSTRRFVSPTGHQAAELAVSFV